MPRLKQIDCSIEVGKRHNKLKEYGARYSDGAVEVFVAVPDQKLPFAIRVQSEGYIAPGLAAFIFIDGVYCGNRNKRRLKMPAEGVDRSQYEVDFLFRQKEMKRDEDGNFVAHDLYFVSANKAATINPEFARNVGTIEIVILRCKNDTDEFGSPALSPRIALESPPSKASPKYARVQSVQEARAPSAKAASHASGGLGGMMGLFDGACDEPEPEPASSISGLDGSEEYGKPVGPEGYVFPVPPPGMGWDSSRGRFAPLESLLPEDRRRAAEAACGIAMDDRPEIANATFGPRFQTLPVTEPPDPRARHNTPLADQDPNAQLDGYGDVYSHPWIYINQFGPGGTRGQNDMRGDMYFGAQGPERQRMKQENREMGHTVSMSNPPRYPSATPMAAMPSQQYPEPQAFPPASNPHTTAPVASQEDGVKITAANVAQYWMEQQAKLKRAHEMRVDNERILRSVPTNHPQYQLALRKLSLVHEAIECSEATCQQLVEEAKQAPSIYEGLRRIGAVPGQQPACTPTQVHFMEQVGQGVYNPDKRQAYQDTKIKYDHDWTKDTDTEIAEFWGGKRRSKPNVGHSSAWDNQKSPHADNNQGGGWAHQQQQSTTKNDQGKGWDNPQQPVPNDQQDQTWGGNNNTVGDAWGTNDPKKGDMAGWNASDEQNDKPTVGGDAAGAWANAARDDNSGNFGNDWVTVDKKSAKSGEWNDGGNQAEPWGKAKSEKSGCRTHFRTPSVAVTPLPENQASNSYIKPYFKGWNGTHSRSGSADPQTNKPMTRSPYDYPAPPMPTILEGKAPGVTHAVVPGKGADYVHRTNRPEYIDSMKAPYAVFAFKYRSPEVLEKIIRLDVRKDTALTVQEAEKERLASLPKDQLVAELMKMKVSPGGGDSSQKAASVKAASAWGGDDDKKSKTAGWAVDTAEKAASNAGGWGGGDNEKPASQEWIKTPSVRSNNNGGGNQWNNNNGGSSYGKSQHADRNSNKSKDTSNAHWANKENAAPTAAAGWDDTTPAVGGGWDGSAEAAKMAAAQPNIAFPTQTPAYTANYAAYQAQADPRFTTGTVTDATSDFHASMATGFEDTRSAAPDHSRGRGRGGLRTCTMYGRGGHGGADNTFDHDVVGGDDGVGGGRGGGRAGRGGRGGYASGRGGSAQYGQRYDAYAVAMHAMENPSQIPAGVPVDRSGLPYADPYAGWSKRPAPPPSVVPHDGQSNPMAKYEKGAEVQEGPAAW